MIIALAYLGGLLVGFTSDFNLHSGSRGAVIYWIGITLFFIAVILEGRRQS